MSASTSASSESTIRKRVQAEALLKSLPAHWDSINLEHKVEMIHVLNPNETNASARIAHGATLIKLCDEAGAVVAFRHCRTPVVTAHMDSVDFLAPVFLGDIVIVRCILTYVSAKSVEVFVQVCAENLISGEVRLTNHAYLTFVSVDTKTGHALPVPPYEPETEGERWYYEQGLARYNERKKKRQERANL
jgi:acyl-CoA hydrolase